MMWRVTRLVSPKGATVCHQLRTKLVGRTVVRDRVFWLNGKRSQQFSPPCSGQLSWRTLHTSSVQHAPAPFLGPLLVKLSKPMARIVFLLIGRRLRNWWASLPPDRRAVYIAKLRQNRKLLYGISALFGGGMGIYYYTHLERTPITGRLRFMMLTEEQLLKVTATENKLLTSLLEMNQVPNNDPRYHRVYHIVARLFAANELDTTDLVKRVKVVVSSEQNAFVIPNGDIYVFTGMLDAVANDDELAGILGHELAHNLLSHVAEKLSRAGFFGVFSVIVFTAIWAMGTSDFASIFASWLQYKIEDILIELPYSRKMEREADEVGLMLTARACYDVTEIPKFWERMCLAEHAELGELGELPPVVDENMDFLSTHPSHEKRVLWLNENMEKALEIRAEMQCPELGSFFRRARKSFFSWLM